MTVGRNTNMSGWIRWKINMKTSSCMYLVLWTVIMNFYVCCLVASSPSNNGYLRDWSDWIIVRAATLMYKLQIQLAISPSHSTWKQEQTILLLIWRLGFEQPPHALGAGGCTCRPWGWLSQGSHWGSHCSPGGWLSLGSHWRWLSLGSHRESLQPWRWLSPGSHWGVTAALEVVITRKTSSHWMWLSQGRHPVTGGGYH